MHAYVINFLIFYYQILESREMSLIAMFFMLLMILLISYNIILYIRYVVINII